MTRWIYLAFLAASLCAAAQAPASGAPSDDPQTSADVQGLLPHSELNGKATLIRGVLKQLDPIHDQLLIRVFGGKDIRIAFDPRTELLHENTRTSLSQIPAGSVVSVDAVMNDGKLFARSVRVAAAGTGELTAQVVRYDAAKNRLVLRDPGSPEDIGLQVTSSTTVLNHGQAASPQALSPGMLVRIKFVPASRSATNIEVLAARGNEFTFAGRVISVDLRSRQVALSNQSDQTVRELSTTSLDPTSLRLLREGADVSIQAEFDGDRYNARTVTLVPRQP
jgi:hypothetical protein